MVLFDIQECRLGAAEGAGGRVQVPGREGVRAHAPCPPRCKAGRIVYIVLPAYFWTVCLFRYHVPDLSFVHNFLIFSIRSTK